MRDTMTKYNEDFWVTNMIFYNGTTNGWIFGVVRKCGMIVLDLYGIFEIPLFNFGSDVL